MHTGHIHEKHRWFHRLGGPLLLAYLTFGAHTDDPCVRERAIWVVEDELSGAFTFTPQSLDRLPDFEKLDSLYPTWHKGDPALGRRFWLEQGYQVHRVDYRVDMVRMMGAFRVQVRGKKLVAWTKKADSDIHPDVWPFQLWSRVDTCENAFVDCDYVVYTINYTIELKKNPTGEWIVVREETGRTPELPNAQKGTCSFADQLGDWCPACECPGRMASNAGQAPAPSGGEADGCTVGCE